MPGEIEVMLGEQLAEIAHVPLFKNRNPGGRSSSVGAEQWVHATGMNPTVPNLMYSTPKRGEQSPDTGESTDPRSSDGNPGILGRDSWVKVSRPPPIDNGDVGMGGIRMPARGRASERAITTTPRGTKSGARPYSGTSGSVKRLVNKRESSGGKVSLAP